MCPTEILYSIGCKSYNAISIKRLNCIVKPKIGNSIMKKILSFLVIFACVIPVIAQNSTNNVINKLKSGQDINIMFAVRKIIDLEDGKLSDVIIIEVFPNHKNGFYVNIANGKSE